MSTQNTPQDIQQDQGAAGVQNNPKPSPQNSSAQFQKNNFQQALRWVLPMFSKNVPLISFCPAKITKCFQHNRAQYVQEYGDKDICQGSPEKSRKTVTTVQASSSTIWHNWTHKMHLKMVQDAIQIVWNIYTNLPCTLGKWNKRNQTKKIGGFVPEFSATRIRQFDLICTKWEIACANFIQLFQQGETKFSRN